MVLLNQLLAYVANLFTVVIGPGSQHVTIHYRALRINVFVNIDS